VDGPVWNSHDLADCGANNNPTRLIMNYDHGVQATFAFVQPAILEDCTLGYPYVTAGNSRTNADFNESEVLTGFALGRHEPARLVYRRACNDAWSRLGFHRQQESEA
jgi:hypothetical protein